MTATPETEAHEFCANGHVRDFETGECVILDYTTAGSCLPGILKQADLRTDREVLLNIEAMMTQIRDLVADVAKESGPVIQQISGHAMFRMFFGKVKTDD